MEVPDPLPLLANADHELGLLPEVASRAGAFTQDDVLVPVRTRDRRPILAERKLTAHAHVVELFIDRVSRQPRLHTLRHLLCEACSNPGRLPPPANTKSVMPIARSAARSEPTSSCVTSPAQRMRSVRVPALPRGARLPRSAAASRSTRCSHRAGASSMRLVSRLPLCSPNFCSTAGGRGTGRLCPRIYLHVSRLRATAKTLAEGAKREYAPEQEPKDAQASKVTLSQSSRRSPARNRSSSSSSTAR